jgi:ABC-type protease/lipase transport system fused ATPase/permease subunit
VDKVFFTATGESAKSILKNVSFQLEPGESMAVVGPRASGKSTLARRIVGVWKPTIGVVRLDGADVFTWDRTDFGNHVGYLPQDIELFSGTVRDNIARMQVGEPEMVVDAALRAGIHQMILELPKGYETQIGEAGAILSGGQRQRIGLARALYGKPRLLVLDEPNSNLDSDGEDSLRQIIARASADGVTVIIIAHRPAILTSIDKMLVLRNGVVELFGPRQEVMSHLIPGGKLRTVETEPAPPPMLLAR